MGEVLWGGGGGRRGDEESGATAAGAGGGRKRLSSCSGENRSLPPSARMSLSSLRFQSGVSEEARRPCIWVVPGEAGRLLAGSLAGLGRGRFAACWWRRRVVPGVGRELSVVAPGSC